MKRFLPISLVLMLILVNSCGEIDPFGGHDSLPFSVNTDYDKAFVTFTSAKLCGSFFDKDYQRLTYGFYYGFDKENLNEFASARITTSGVFEAEIKGLKSGKHYYYQAVIKNKAKDEVSGKIEEFYTFTEGPVDLGLPSGLKWDTCNVGATLPTEYGNYYAWGETETKPYYDWTTYKYCSNGDEIRGITKYISTTDYYIKPSDGKRVLDSSDDIAKKELGSNWRMPESADFVELFQNCDCKNVCINGIYGYKLVGKKDFNNENFIFLPCAGYFTKGDVYGDGSFAMYWSSTLSQEQFSYNAYCANVTSSPSNVHEYRQNGLPVRAVCK